MDKRNPVVIEKYIRKLFIPSRGGYREVYQVQMVNAVGKKPARSFATYEEARAVKAEWLRAGVPVGAAADLDLLAPRADDRQASVEDGLDKYATDLEARGLRDAAARCRQIPKALAKLDAGRALLAHDIFTLPDQALYDMRLAREADHIEASTILRDLGIIRTMLKRAWKGRGEYTFPTKVLPKDNNTRVRYLEKDQEREVFRLLPPEWHPFYRLQMWTLMRASEVAGLTRKMIQLNSGRIELPKTKDGPQVVEPLADKAVEILRARLKAMGPDETLLFANPETGRRYSRVHVSRIWRRAARAAGLEDFHNHDLRHHGAMVLRAHGYSDGEIAQMGRWKSTAMVRRYSQSTNPTLRTAAKRLAGGMPAHAVRSTARRRLRVA